MYALLCKTNNQLLLYPTMLEEMGSKIYYLLEQNKTLTWWDELQLKGYSPLNNMPVFLERFDVISIAERKISGVSLKQLQFVALII